MKKKRFTLMLVAALALIAAVPVSAAPADVDKVEKTVIVDGGEQIHYAVLAKKGKDKKEARQTFLVLHGAFMSSGATDSVAAELNKKYPKAKVVQVDLPSHGESQTITGPKETVEDIATTVGAAVEKMRRAGDIQGDLIPVGWSMGGSTAMQMALQGVPMKKIVLLNSAPEWSNLGFFAGMSPETTVETFHGAFLGDMKINASPALYKELSSKLEGWTASPETCVADVKALLSFNIVDRLKELPVPVLIISGDQDVVATVDNQNLMHKLIPDNDLEMIEGDAHTLLMKQGKKLAQLISHFEKK